MLEPPQNLEKIVCHFCDEDKSFSGNNMNQLVYKLYTHLEEHESIHHGDEDKIQRRVSYCCRLCPRRDFSQTDLGNHVCKHSLLLKNKENRRRPHEKESYHTRPFEKE